MLSNEKVFFLSALSDYVSGRKTDVPQEIDETELLSISKQQQTDAILYIQTHLPSLQISFASITSQVVKSRKLLGLIHTEFSNANIPYLVFKGVEIGSYYSFQELRAMGDIDILVNLENKEKAGKILEQMGFSTSNEEKCPDHEWVYFKGNFEIELHHRLLYNANTNEEKHIAFTDRVWDYTTTEDKIEYHLEPEFHFVFLLLHIRKHLIWAGIGIKQFLDLTVMIKNANLDWKKVEDYISELDMLPFSGKCFAFIDRWFDIRCPIAHEQLTDEFYEYASDTILSNGVFGRLDKKSAENNYIINVTRKRGRLIPTLTIIFPPYREMIIKYPVLSGFPILLPIMWIIRMAESVLHKKSKAGLSLAMKHLIKNNEIKEREKILNAWGI